MYTLAYIFMYKYYTHVCLDNVNGIQVVDLEESFRMRQSKMICRLTCVRIWPFPFRKGVIHGELARGGWGNQGNPAGGTR